MQRDRNNHVTAFAATGRYPVLVLEPYGGSVLGNRWSLANWQRALTGRTFLKPEDIDPQKLSTEERDRWQATVKLAKALEEDDRLVIEEVWPRVVGISSPDIPVMVAAKMTAKNPTLEHANLLAAILSKEASRARLVLLWRANQFLPAIVCPDVRAALYIQALQGVMRICPQCDKVFVPKRPDQNYCSIRCREAHRVARWRLTPQGKRALKRAALKRARKRKFTSRRKR